MKDKVYLVLGLVIIFWSVFIFFDREITEVNKTRIIYINNLSIETEVADTERAREKGLSGRSSLSEGAGMLFIFDDSGQYGFWMKDMNFAIDIIWISEEMQIVGIERRIAPDTYPKVFYPNRKIKYVLEVPAGYSDKYNINIGDEVKTSYKTRQPLRRVVW